MKALQIFRPGKHTASDGRVFEFTEAQLRDAVAAYNPELHEAPLVIGHPTSAAPAYGWVKELAFDEKAGGVVMADPHQVEPQFEEMVQSGRFKKRSAAWYLPDTPGNPTPGKHYLHHVAFLGAKAPAVKGLKDAQFSADDKGVVEFMDWSDKDNATLWRGLRDWIIGKFGKDEADKVIPDYLVTSLQESAVKPEPAAAGHPSYQESDVLTKEQQEELQRREAALKADREKLERERAEFAEREKTLRATETAQQLATRRRECAEFVDAQVKEGRVLPAQAAGLVAFMAALPADGIVEFGEGDKAVKKPGAEWLRDYLKAQPKVVDFQERAGGELPKDMSAEQLAAKAVEFQEAEAKAGREISITAAVTHVKNQAAR